jgi:hypothetical protein
LLEDVGTPCAARAQGRALSRLIDINSGMKNWQPVGIPVVPADGTAVSFALSAADPPLFSVS